jgi:hypothetical protein
MPRVSRLPAPQPVPPLDTAMQRKLRALRPWPCGVVFIQRPGMTLEQMRVHFRTMRRLGFTCLKQCQLVDGEDWRAVYHAALDEGIVPWWYDDACHEEPTPALLRSLGVAPNLPPSAFPHRGAPVRAPLEGPSGGSDAGKDRRTGSASDRAQRA